MYSVCIVCVQCVYNVCIVCIVCVRCVYSVCTVCIVCVYSVCTVCIVCVYCVYSVCVLCVLGEGPQSRGLSVYIVQRVHEGVPEGGRTRTVEGRGRGQ